jgi:hypothetical protein
MINKVDIKNQNDKYLRMEGVTHKQKKSNIWAMSNIEIERGK